MIITIDVNEQLDPTGLHNLEDHRIANLVIMGMTYASLVNARVEGLINSEIRDRNIIMRIERTFTITINH